MRSHLFVLLAIAMLVAVGCGRSKTSGLTPDEAVKQARNNADSGQQSNLGLGGGAPPTNSDDSAEKNETDNQDNDQKAEEGNEQDGSSSDDPSQDASAPENAQPSRPARRPAQSSGGFRRRRRPPNPSMGGRSGSLTQPAENTPAQDDESEEDDDQNSDSQDEDDDSNDVAETPEPEPRDSLLDRAERAFAAKHDPEAFQYLYAHMLTDDDALQSAPPSWFDGIKEPRVGLRWGVAVTYLPGDFDGDPPTIGDEEDDGDSGNGAGAGGGNLTLPGGFNRRRRFQRGGNSDRNSNSNRRQRNQPARPPAEDLRYYVGDFGEALVERYEMRRVHNDAYFGTIMSELDLDDVEPASGSGNQAGRRNRGGGQTTTGTQGGGGGAGLLTPDGGAGGLTSDGPPSSGGRNSGGRSSGGRNNARSNNRNVDAEYEADETSLAPGMMYLGTGNSKDMLAKAASHNIDVLVMFEVKIKHTERRNGDTSTKSNTRLQAFSVKSGEQLIDKPRQLSHLAVASAREKGREDPVQLELDKLFREMADQQFKSKALPDFGADKYKQRFTFLLGKDFDNPLPVLVEMKHYLNAGYITSNEFLSACEKFLGDDSARDLIDGDESGKEEALREFLPGQFEVNVGNNDQEIR